MSLLVTAALAAAGVAIGRLVVRAATKKPGPPPDPTATSGSPTATPGIGSVPPPKPPEKKAPVQTASDPLELFACRIGDVVLRSQGDEAWLAGALVLSEDAPVLALFFAPDAGHDTSILARPKPSNELTWLAPVSGVTLFAGAEPPNVLEHDGMRFERERRLPLRVKRIGSGAPDYGETVVTAEYRSAGFERLLVVVASAKVHIFRGVLLEEGMFDILPGSKTD